MDEDPVIYFLLLGSFFWELLFIFFVHLTSPVLHLSCLSPSSKLHPPIKKNKKGKKQTYKGVSFMWMWFKTFQDLLSQSMLFALYLSYKYYYAVYSSFSIPVYHLKWSTLYIYFTYFSYSLRGKAFPDHIKGQLPISALDFLPLWITQDLSPQIILSPFPFSLYWLLFFIQKPCSPLLYFKTKICPPLPPLFTLSSFHCQTS